MPVKKRTRRRPVKVVASGIERVIDRTFTDPTIARAIAEQEIIGIAENAKATRAILEAGLHVPENIAGPDQIHWVEDRLNPPQPAPAPLLPDRWWKNAAAPMEPQRRQPILVVSPQVAEVLNIGIDRVVDVAADAKANLDDVRGMLVRYRWAGERQLEFLRNVKAKLSASTSTTLVGDALAVVDAIGTLLEEPWP